jgi:NADH:ubiquinone oxidoreductase subunit 6 (subunit J)
MTVALVFFYLYAAVAVAGALGLVLARNIVHAVMSLFATLIAIAALFLLLGSEFLAAMQLFVYGGAITILVLFVLMLTGPKPRSGGRSQELVRLLSGALCIAFFGAVAAVIWQTPWRTAPSAIIHDTASIATILFSRYVLPFEIAGLSLTIALIGAIVIAREDDVLAVLRQERPAIEVGAASPVSDDEDEPQPAKPVATSAIATPQPPQPWSYRDEWDDTEDGEA